MEEKKSVKEVKELLLLAVDMVNAGLEIAKDGKVSLDDLSVVFKLVPAMPEAFTGLSELPLELKDIEAEEVAELTAAVMAKLAIEDAKAKLILEKSLKVVACVAELVMAIVK